jgi:hypothetical protein
MKENRMTEAVVAETVADQALTVACSAVGAHWAQDFPICVERGVWGSKSSTADKMSHAPAFERIRPGQLGIAVHGFGWQNPEQPPRNATGSTYGPRAPLEHFMRAQFTEYMLFEVEGPAYKSKTRVWSQETPDEWDLRFPINVYAHEKGVALRMNEINPAIAEAIRMSGIFASMPWVIAPATLGSPSIGTLPGRLTRSGSTDALGQIVYRREASALRAVLLAGRSIAPCAFCEQDCVAEDLEVAHLKKRRACVEDERLDTGVAVLACVTCHHCFDIGAILVDAEGTMRTTTAATASAWRQEMLSPLDGRRFSCFGPSNEGYLAWHYEEVAKRLDVRQLVS